MKIVHTLILIFALLVALPAYAAPVDDATVNLYCSLRSGNKVYSTSGSGVFMSERGIILTNAHVAQYFLLATDTKRVKGQCWVRTGSPATNAYRADVLYLPPAWIDANAEAIKKRTPSGTGEYDFALLYVTQAKKGALPPTFPSVSPSLSAPMEGESVTITGYPTDGLKGDGIKKALKRISTTSSIANVRGFTRYSPDVITIASSSVASAGISGGPIIKEDGTLAGIVVAKSETQLRAITPIHINNALARSGSTITAITLGDLPARAAMSRALLTPQHLAALRDGLLRKR